MHVWFKCFVVFPLRSLTLFAQAAGAAIAAMQFYNDHEEDAGLEALREQEVHRRQAVESLSKWSEQIRRKRETRTRKNRQTDRSEQTDQHIEA